MIFTIIFYIIGIFLSAIAFVLPENQIWPEKIFEGIEYFVHTFMNLNDILMIIPTIFDAAIFFLRFLFWFGAYLLLVKMFNYFRGAGTGL